MVDLLTAAEPVLIETLAMIFVAVATWAAAAIRRYAGAKTAAILQAALTEAMERGIAQAAADPNMDTPTGAADYVQRMMPDTVKALGASTRDLIDRAKAQMAQGGVR
jgi:hypothetical protein